MCVSGDCSIILFKCYVTQFFEWAIGYSKLIRTIKACMQNVVCSRVGAPFIIFLNTHCYDMTTTVKSDFIIIFNLEKKNLHRFLHWMLTFITPQIAELLNFLTSLAFTTWMECSRNHISRWCYITLFLYIYRNQSTYLYTANLLTVFYMMGTSNLTWLKCHKNLSFSNWTCHLESVSVIKIDLYFLFKLHCFLIK